jgi:hypothetical protein
LECPEIRRDFVAGRVPAGPAVELHLQGCPSCRELFAADAKLGRQLALGVQPELDPGDLFRLVERDLGAEQGLRAKLRALPTSVRAGVLLGVAAALLVFQLLLKRRPDLAEYSPVVFGGVLGIFVVALVVGVRRLTRGATAPLASQRTELVVALALLLVPALAALLAPLGTESAEALAAWGSPASCFSYGAAFVVPLVLLYWLFERRDDVPWTALVSAGALAGVAANLLLHAHCGSANLGHLLLGHATIGLVWALALRLVWGSAQAR